VPKHDQTPSDVSIRLIIRRTVKSRSFFFSRCAAVDCTSQSEVTQQFKSQVSAVGDDMMSAYCKSAATSSSSAVVDALDEERERMRLERIESELYYSIETDDPDRLGRLLSSTADSAISSGGLGFVDPNTTFSGVDPLGKSLFWSPLHFCCEKGRRRCAELLLAAGANPDVGDRWCMTPLMYAVQTEWFDMAGMMIDAGATIDWQDTRGRTPLSLAVDCSDDT
jgi:hypothetical protein